MSELFKKTLGIIFALLIPSMALAEFTPEEAAGVAITVNAGHEVRVSTWAVSKQVLNQQTPENFQALAEAMTLIVEAARASADITGDLVNAKLDGDIRSRQQMVDDAKQLVTENLSRCLAVASVLGGAGLPVPRGVTNAIVLYGSFPDLSYLDHEFTNFPGLIGVSPDGKNIHGDYNVAQKWARHTLTFGQSAWATLVADYASGQYTPGQREAMERVINFHHHSMDGIHTAMAMILGVCDDDDGFCTKGRFFFMQDVQELSAARNNVASEFHNAAVNLAQVHTEGSVAPPNWALAVSQFHNSWRGIDKLSAAVIGEFEGRAGVNFEARDLLIVDLEAQLTALEDELSQCESGGGGPDCTSFIERIAEKNAHLRTIESLAAQRTEQ